MTAANMDEQNRKVLIVDDDDLARVLLAHIFERLNLDGLELLMAEDGEEAVQLAETQRPDLILLDLLLPKLNGYDVCQQVRMIPEYSPYIIILTARGNKTDRQVAQSIGANEFMTKPFNPSRLTGILGDIWGI